jgi:hypothetical protein
MRDELSAYNSPRDGWPTQGGRTMRRIPTSAALAALAIAAGATSAAAQQTYTYPPAPGSYVARPVDNRAVLPAFAPRGGIGTTPFLGNTRGLGGYSVNYDAPRTRTVTPRPARRGWLFRRYR